MKKLNISDLFNILRHNKKNLKVKYFILGLTKLTCTEKWITFFKKIEYVIFNFFFIYLNLINKNNFIELKGIITIRFIYRTYVKDFQWFSPKRRILKRAIEYAPVPQWDFRVEMRSL